MRPHSSGPGQGGPGLACPAEPSLPGGLPGFLPNVLEISACTLLPPVLSSPVTLAAPWAAPLAVPLSFYQESPSEDHAAQGAGACSTCS